MDDAKKDTENALVDLLPADHPTRKPEFRIQLKHITLFYKILKLNNLSVSCMNNAQIALHEGLTALGYLERTVPVTAQKEDLQYRCTVKGANEFLLRYKATNYIQATEDYLAELNIPPRMTETHLESLLFLIEKGPVDDGDVPSKSTRDDLVDWGYVARVRVNNQDGFNAATYKGRNKFCEFYGVDTMNEAYERRLITKVQNSSKSALGET